MWAVSIEEIPLKTSEIHILVTRCNTYRDSSRKAFIYLSFPQIASEQLPGIVTWYKQFNYPTTHPVYRAPRRHEKGNFHRLIELNLIDPEKILEFCIL